MGLLPYDFKQKKMNQKSKKWDQISHELMAILPLGLGIILGLFHIDHPDAFNQFFNFLNAHALLIMTLIFIAVVTIKIAGCLLKKN